ncbi:MAG: phosphoenolpyruvate--protein phosphotransferase [Gammaproteobacteria bacterium]|nr:phosphoenolpyruvate--protein phosphotransferase [Gammaproteobacteria bacterium]MBU2058324.1 phosphoenolpyruvate--protein phosphotransferase [Gammaproteobacteria bacterium]MBU2176623.1 phosphoenolpyruvate--protein phosphotransferase [Gammaproteobacteria bacterium]MBU2248435.1 phosphoenolpyruvate--protein phosphotransferase [Gammaproteobacteria bacterium]MBU2345702.1 phosphoenolpyruvate--protein phosphotransferase [Gammaproteobacteria bacterium]
MLSQLRRIVQDVAQEPVLNNALAGLVSNVKNALKTECCSVYLANYEQQHFMLMATDGLNPEAVGQISIGFSEGLIGWVGQREEPINLAQAHLHPRFKVTPEVSEDRFSAFLGCPIIHHRKVLGVLTIQQGESRVFSEDEESFLVTLGVQLASVLVHAEMRQAASQNSKQQKSTGQLQGLPGAPGIAIGEGFVLEPSSDFDAISLKKVDDPEKELSRFYKAVKITKAEFNRLAERMAGHLPPDALAIFDVYHQLLDAASLGNEIEKQIHEGWCAKSALKRVVEKFARQFDDMDDPYLRERGTDIRDLGQRVLNHLLDTEQRHHKLPEKVVLVADNVTATMLAEIPRAQLVAIVSLKGSVNSHAAIMARALGIPAVMGLDELPLFHWQSKRLIVDGYRGQILVAPAEAIVAEYQALISEDAQLSARYQSEMHLKAQSACGAPFSLMVNAGLAIELESTQPSYTDGIGLYRTEFPFIMRNRFPTEAEQIELYKKVLASHPTKAVVMRTLDVGGDKALPYFSIIEENPFLGWRGIRLTLDHPEIFLVQIRAMLKANIGQGNLHILLPMISDLAEVDESLRLIKQATFELTDELAGTEVQLPKAKVGVMIEVPSIMYQLPELARKIDFCSVGTNDLTQYLLAVDRNNPRVAALYDAMHPAVLRALHQMSLQAQGLQLPMSICGELAGEPAGVLILAAMGYDKFSMNSSNLAKIKWLLRRVHLSELQLLLPEILACQSPKQVRLQVQRFLDQKQLLNQLRA